MPDTPRAAIVAPFSGPRSAWGDLLLRAAARRDDVDWIAVDDEGRAELGSQCARAVLAQRPAAVVGHFNSGGAERALPAYAAAGMPCLLPLATAPGLTALAPGLVLRGCPTDDAQARALVAALGGAGDGARVARGAVLGPVGASAGAAPRPAGARGARVGVVDDDSAYGIGLAERIAAAGATRLRVADAVGWRGGLVVSGVHRAAAGIARELAGAGCTARLAFVDDCGVAEFSELAGDAARGALVARFPDGGQACVDEMVDVLADALAAGPGFRGPLLIGAIRASSGESYDDRGERAGARWDVRPLAGARG